MMIKKCKKSVKKCRFFKKNKHFVIRKYKSTLFEPYSYNRTRMKLSLTIHKSKNIFCEYIGGDIHVIVKIPKDNKE